MARVKFNAHEFDLFVNAGMIKGRKLDVYNFYNSNAGSSVKQCAENLGVSYTRALQLIKHITHENRRWKERGMPSKTAKVRKEKIINQAYADKCINYLERFGYTVIKPNKKAT